MLSKVSEGWSQESFQSSGATPIVPTPFQKIAMDIVGPLPSGNHYVLVICDYATCYPEAISVQSIDAENIAEELIKLFALVGIPQSIS